MKKVMLTLALAAMMLLSSCAMQNPDLKEPVVFFYPRREIAFGTDSPVIGQEIREGTGHGTDLEYLISTYLQGPLSKDLRAMFPAGTKLVSVSWKKDCLHIVLNAYAASMKNIDLSLAASCLAKSCFTAFDISCIHLESTPLPDGTAISVRIYQDSLILTDDTPMQPSEPADSQ